MVPAIGSRTNAKIVTTRAADDPALTLTHNWDRSESRLGYVVRRITLSGRVGQGERSPSRRSARLTAMES